MPRLYPFSLDSDTKSSAERRLYEACACELDDEWVIFHHVKWIGHDEMGRPRDGEADFVVAHPHLGVLVIEAKGEAFGSTRPVGTSSAPVEMAWNAIWRLV